MNGETYTTICTTLETLRTQGNPYWNAGPRTIELLAHHIAQIPGCRMIEIGTSNGYTALRLVNALQGVQGTLTTIESHRERGDLAERHLSEAEVTDVVHLLRGHAPEVFSRLTGTYDLIFLDATKYEHASYVEGLIPYLRPGSVIVADNVTSHPEAMSVFVRFMQDSPLFSTEIFPIETGVLVARVHPVSP